MIIGEAPGRKEVEVGMPFCGQSGRLLETALKACGIDRRDVYITNVVKEMPLDEEGKIRRPTIEEMGDWSPILVGEIQVTQPEAILCLGKVAVQAVTFLQPDLVPAGSKIGNVYTAWHPAHVLRARSKQGEWFDQVRQWGRAIA